MLSKISNIIEFPHYYGDKVTILVQLLPYSTLLPKKFVHTHNDPKRPHQGYIWEHF